MNEFFSNILWNRGDTIRGDENEINSLQTGPNEGSIVLVDRRVIAKPSEKWIKM